MAATHVDGGVGRHVWRPIVLSFSARGSSLEVLRFQTKERNGSLNRIHEGKDRQLVVQGSPQQSGGTVIPRGH